MFLLFGASRSLLGPFFRGLGVSAKLGAPPSRRAALPGAGAPDLVRGPMPRRVLGVPGS